MTHALRSRSRKTAFATLIVLWAIALTGLVLVTLQSSAFRQAAQGREALARVRAYWAARAGVESQIAKLTFNTITPDQASALTLNTDLASVAYADLGESTYSIRHFDGTNEVDGPEDAHTKLNVNRLEVDDLMLLDSMDEGTAQSIVNWINGVDDSAALGADIGAYTGLRYPYEPREAAVRSLKELELVQGVDPTLLRGEDANYNGRLDPNEDDGDLSFPPDNADGILDAGWSRYLTAVSELGVSGGYSRTGKLRIDLQTSSADDVASRLGVDRNQAQAIVTHAAEEGAAMRDFVRTNLSEIAATSQGTTLLTGQNSAVANLTTDQLAVLLSEAFIKNELRGDGLRKGKININTVKRETLERFARIETSVADTIISDRDGRSGGYLNITDMLSISGMTQDTLADLMEHIDVSSNVFVVTCRGKDKASGVEVEIVATLDRSSIPVVIRDLVVR